MVIRQKKLNRDFRNKQPVVQDGFRVYKQKNLKKGTETFSCILDKDLGIKAVYDLSGKCKDVLQRHDPRGNSPKMQKRHKALEEQ
jgi:hypothetical protein